MQAGATGLVALLLFPNLAVAHAVLLRGTPVAGQVLPAGHFRIDLQFNSRIERKASQLLLRDPDDGTRRLVIEDGPADTLRAEADLGPGPHVLHWQVLAVDGHLTRGTVAFAVRPTGDPAPVGQPAR